MIGTRLGQYRIDALLGRGGMGAVYLATDEMLGRQVAIKVLREPADADGPAVERFRKEAQILARLDHPHILRLYGFSQHEGLLYMVTEFVKGEPLQRRLEQGTPLPVADVLAWSRQILDALDYAHQMGVVHRDIKPANILVDERGRARLLDFGIARIVGVEGPTQTGHAVGTLMYMAPEQILDEPVDGRADLYAFAVVLCQMLAGRRPYRATTTVGLIREIVDGPAPDLPSLLPPEAAALTPAIRRALSRRPADRPATADEMLREMEASGAGAVTAPPMPPAQPTVAETDNRAWAATESSAAVATLSSSATIPVPPPAARRRVGPAVLIAPALLLVSAVATGWYVFGPSRMVTPRIAMATATPPATTVDASPTPQAAPPAPRQVAVPDPTTAPPLPTSSTGSAATPVPRRALPPTRSAPVGATEAHEPAAPTTPIEVEPAPVDAPAPPPAPAPRVRPAGPAVVEFKDMILIDRIDDEDEEIDVSMRLDASRVVVLDEDGLAKRSIAYDSIGRATYNSRRPGRFSLRRSPSHWLTLEVGTTPIVLRLNGKTFEQVLATLDAHGVTINRQP